MYTELGKREKKMTEPNTIMGFTLLVMDESLRI
jgi:hypothetical protein